MRWRIAIAVLVVIGIAGAVYVGTRPKKGTVEWHKDEYLHVLRKMRNQTFEARLKGLCTKVTGIRFQEDRVKSFQELQAAREALIKFGFLEEKKIGVSRPPGMVMQKASTIEKAIPEERARFTSLTTGNKTVIITAMPEDISCWADAVRQAESAMIAERSGQLNPKTK
jgi:hypothetical protein